MNLNPIEAYEGHWQERLDENIYRINIEKEATVALLQKTWIGYSNHSRVLIKGREQDKPTAFLYWGIVLEIEAQEKHKVILFQLLEIMNEEEILLHSPESEYPEHLNDHIDSTYGACGYFGNKMDLYKQRADRYFLTADFYGNKTSVAIRVIDGKMYAWYTSLGFTYYMAYYGKYLVPDWLKEKIERPADDPYIRYKE